MVSLKLLCHEWDGWVVAKTMIQEIVGQVPPDPCVRAARSNGWQGVRTGCHIRQWVNETHESLKSSLLKIMINPYHINPAGSNIKQAIFSWFLHETKSPQDSTDSVASTCLCNLKSDWSLSCNLDCCGVLCMHLSANPCSCCTPVRIWRMLAEIGG